MRAAPSSSPAFAPLERSSVTSQVARRLLAEITTGELRHGDRLPSERTLSATLGVGRSAVREALAALDLLGVVVTREGSGSYLNSTSDNVLPHVIEWGLILGQQSVLDLVEARSELEVSAAGMAAVRRDEADLAAMAAQVEAMAASTDADVRTAADLAFHAALTAAAHNVVVRDVLGNLHGMLATWIRRVIDVASDVGSAEEEHAAVLAAVRSGDAAAARAAMTLHMEGSRRRLERTVDLSAPST